MTPPATSVPGPSRSRWLTLLLPLIPPVVLFVVIWFATSTLSPLPPGSVTMVTGPPEGGAYQEVGKRYQAILARQGIDLKLVPTAGALENLAPLPFPEQGHAAGRGRRSREEPAADERDVVRAQGEPGGAT
jgi:hypothetical protein